LFIELFKPHKELKNGIEIGSIFGAGEADVTYISPTSPTSEL
jgi:hypothetical protein